MKSRNFKLAGHIARMTDAKSKAVPLHAMEALGGEEL
jgi:hypothetical protein